MVLTVKYLKSRTGLGPLVGLLQKLDCTNISFPEDARSTPYDFNGFVLALYHCLKIVSATTQSIMCMDFV